MRSRTKIKLEEYIDFHENRLQPDLTINQINQIINMHGFIKLHNRPKKELLDALSSIDEMMSPLRSTVQESISSCAFLSIEEVKEDLAVLEWQECPVQSIMTAKPVEEDPTDGEIWHLSSAAFARIKRKMRTKSKEAEADPSSR
ncbi:putative pathogenesis-related protein isoform X1 [Cinnamomum micranthum f. kanehirae]|uniref:Putative pathogenesis-related protein isoform X1 n=1 Tax=Cinnamomum micranthum f. kanehirae TaxID=337451 RepID=A0A443PU78_9MAGN|nr:putative pathogenesis-related protein isoform X1 [Cinnamomum micranthum f. kanehirae]